MAHQHEKLAATADLVAERRAMLDLLNLKRGEHVLDVGSGNGIFALEMLEIVHFHRSKTLVAASRLGVKSERPGH